MLVSHEHKFIFIKTQKCAGTSTEISLGRFCQHPEDIVTPTEYTMQQYLDAGVTPRNYEIKKQGIGRLNQHTPASIARNVVGKKRWDEYTTFCTVRNPWARAVSLYHFWRGIKVPLPDTFERFILDRLFMVELPFYCQDAVPIVDRVMRFEHLQQDLQAITEELGLDWDGWLPRVNSDYKPSRKHYTEYYTQEMRDLVAEVCATEIALHGFEFGSEFEGATRGLSWPSADSLPEFPAALNAHLDNNVLRGATCRPAISAGVSFEEDEGKVAMRIEDREKPFHPNATALDVIALCDSARTVEDIFHVMREQHAGHDGTLSTDLLVLFDQLRREAVIQADELLPAANPQRMKLDLRETPFLVINLRRDTRRRDFMAGQMRDLGLNYEFIPAVEFNTPNRGATRSHLKALAHLGGAQSFVVLEDDCLFSEEFSYEFDLPADTDAFFLGTSYFGINKPGAPSWGVYRRVNMVPVEKDYLRIFNMLSLHAVVYFSNDYPQTTIDTIVRGIGVYGDLYPADVYTAMLQTSHKVLAPRVPLITQTASMGGAELATKKPLGDLLVS